MSRLTAIEARTKPADDMTLPSYNWRLYYPSGDLGSLGRVYAASAEHAMEIVRDEALMDGVSRPFTVEITKIATPRKWEIRDVTLPHTQEVK